MPDFETIRLGAPVAAEYEFRGEMKRVEVAGLYDITVPSLSKADTTLVARLSFGARRVDYRSIEGRLFRPFYQSNCHPWKLGDFGKRQPPLGNGESIRRLRVHRTPLLASPWLQWEPGDDESSEAARARARRAAPRAWHDVGERLQSLATRGLRMVDGALYHETRAPMWALGSRGYKIEAMEVDSHRTLNAVLLDPRIAHSDLAALARETGIIFESNALKIFEASLLPDSTEAESLAAFALWVYDRLANGAVDERGVESLYDALTLLREAENAISRGLAFDECYGLIERWPARRLDDERCRYDHELTDSRIAANASVFLSLHQRFPPPALAPTLNADDAEDIADGFLP